MHRGDFTLDAFGGQIFNKLFDHLILNSVLIDGVGGQSFQTPASATTSDALEILRTIMVTSSACRFQRSADGET